MLHYVKVKNFVFGFSQIIYNLHLSLYFTMQLTYTCFTGSRLHCQQRERSEIITSDWTFSPVLYLHFQQESTSSECRVSAIHSWTR